MRARRTDANQCEIVKAYRALHCDVIDLSRVGKDCPDILVGLCGIDQQVEIKTEKGKVSPGQVEHAISWRGRKPIVIRSVSEAIEHVYRVRKEFTKPTG